MRHAGTGPLESATKGAPGKIWPLYPLMFVPGIVLLLGPSTVNRVMEEFGLRTGAGSLLQVSYFIGGVIGIILITKMMTLLSTRRVILLNVALLVVSLAACAASRSYPVLTAFYFSTGFANGILITFPGVFVTRMRKETAHRDQNILYSFFSLGVVSGPLLCEFVASSLSWRWAFVAPAMLIVPLSAPSIIADLGRVKGVLPFGKDSVSKVLSYKGRLFGALLSSLLLYIAAESAVSMWIVTFMERKHGMTSAQWLLTSLWAGITVGRWICGYLTKVVSPRRILAFITFCAGVSVLCAAAASQAWLTALFFVLTGFFFSGIYPLLVGYSASFPEDVSPVVFTMFVSAGGAGGAVLIFASGIINQIRGYLSLGMALISVPVFLVLAVVAIFRKEFANS